MEPKQLRYEYVIAVSTRSIPFHVHGMMRFVYPHIITCKVFQACGE